MIDLNGTGAPHPPPSDRLAKAARRYAGELGLPVFPCRQREKTPLTTHGVLDASMDDLQVERWWKQWPDANIGLATGAGILVLDIDGPDGEATLADLIAVHGPLPDTPEQTTGKGRHLLFSVDGEVRNTSRKLGAGLDTRGDGGYIIVAPSIHPSGKRYAWVEGRKPSDLEIAPAPAWLLAGLAKPKISQKASEGLRRPEPSAIPDAYVRRAVDGEFQRVASAPKGARNGTINEAAFALGQLVGAGVLDETTARRTLEAAADACGALSEEREKTLGTIARGLAAGALQPRDLSGVGRERRTVDHPSSRRADQERTSEPNARPADPGPAEPLPIAAVWSGIDPAKIPRRRWLYDRYLCRGILSVTISPGGIGKSSLALVEALQMATGRKLHGRALPAGPIRVWYINLEDPPEELDRRLAGACLHYGINDAEIGGRLFINSGIDTPLKLARLTDRRQARLDEDAFAHLEEQIRSNRIDAIVIDPFVSSHEVEESDNGMIDRVAKRLARVAMRCDVAIGLVHHTKKLAPGQEHDADSARGASALVNAARVVRVLNSMTKDEADKASIRAELRRLYFRASRDKQNLAPPDEDKNWYHMAGVNLGNGTPPYYIDSDEVGVAERWEWPTDTVAAEVERAAVERTDALRGRVLDGIVACLGDTWIAASHVIAHLKTNGHVSTNKTDIDRVLKSLAGVGDDAVTLIEHNGARIEVESTRTARMTYNRFRVVRGG